VVGVGVLRGMMIRRRGVLGTFEDFFLRDESDWMIFELSIWF
jgi:hypothetical protein